MKKLRFVAMVISIFGLWCLAAAAIMVATAHFADGNVLLGVVSLGASGGLWWVNQGFVHEFRRDFDL